MTDEILSQAEPIYCKGLTKKTYNKQYRETNKTKILEYKKQYRKTKKAKIAVDGKEYRQANKYKIAEYRQKNIEKLSEQAKSYRIVNKAKIANQRKGYGHSKDGLIANIYGRQRHASKHRNHSPPNYNQEELKLWIFEQINFEDLYQAWVESGFNKNLTPSCDRLDDYKPYTLDNIRLVTWIVNNRRSHSDMKNGINNKHSKAVLQLTRDGAIIAEHHSASHASRVTGTNQSCISFCCNGKHLTAGGFVWRFIK